MRRRIGFQEIIRSHRKFGGVPSFDPSSISNLIYFGDPDLSATLAGSIITALPSVTGSNSLVTVGSPIVGGGQNGKRTCLFGGLLTGQYADGTFSSSFGVSGATIFVVLKLVTPGINSVTNDIFFSGDGMVGLALSSASGPATSMYNGVSLLASPQKIIANGVFEQITTVYSGASSVLRESGIVIAGPGDAGSLQPFTGFQLAGLLGTRTANIDVAQLLIYDRVLSGSEISAVESYQKTRYGL